MYQECLLLPKGVQDLLLYVKESQTSDEGFGEGNPGHYCEFDSEGMKPHLPEDIMIAKKIPWVIFDEEESDIPNPYEEHVYGVAFISIQEEALIKIPEIGSELDNRE